MTDLKNIDGKKIVKMILICLAIFVIVLAIFSAGMFVGLRKARFSYAWGENYHKNFGGPPIGQPWHKSQPPRDFLRKARGGEFINPNGISGLVIKSDTATLYIKGDDGVEKNVVISKDTLIRRGQDTIQAADLTTDERVVILGAPSSTGQIEAKLIRVFDK